MWPILSIFLKWNTERLELAQGYVEFLWHIYHKKLVLLLCQSKACQPFAQWEFRQDVAPPV